MKSNVTKLSDTSAKLDIEVVVDEVKDLINKSYKDLAEKVNIPGFRKGHIPRKVLDQKVGKGYVLEEVVNNAINKYYQQAALDNNIKAMAQPEVDVEEVFDFDKDGSVLKFAATVDVRPEIKIPSLEGKEVHVEISDVDDKAVDQQLENLRQRMATKNENGETELPELDDNFAASLEADSIDELKKRIKEDLGNQMIAQTVGKAGDDLLDEVLKGLDIPLPEKVVDQQVEYFLERQAGAVKDGEEKKEPTAEEKKLAKKRAESDIRSQVFLDSYADENDIKVGQNEILNYLSNMAMSYGIGPDQFIQMMVQNGQLPLAAAEVSRSKTLAHMLRQVKVLDQNNKEVDYTPWIGAGDDDAATKKATKKAAAKKTGAGRTSHAAAKKPAAKKTATTKEAK
jgi:FKBP-type peptidyl-prolyl cis-trans isomerase (trigger factor)